MDAGNNEIGGETTSLMKALIMGNLQMMQQSTGTFLQGLDRTTLAGIQNNALPTRIAGLATASHVPYSNPYEPAATK